MDPRGKAQEKKQQQQALLDRAFDRLVGSQLSALQAKGSKTLTEEDEERYRATLAAEREAAAKKKRKVLSAEHAELARTTGLSGQVVAMMAQASGGDDSVDADDADGRVDRKSSSKKRSKKNSRSSSRKSSGSKRKKKDRKRSSSSSKHRRSRGYCSDSSSSRNSYSSYSSYSSDSYSSSSSGSFSGRSDDDKRRKKSKKKHHRKSKESKKRKHKHKSSKSDRKRDRKKSRRDDGDKDKAAANTTSSSGNLTSQFGKYGIIRESDFTNNQKVRRSFEMWLAEVKAVSSFTGPKYELLEFFKEFAEDYNTATLPHMKYYDYDKWEMEDYAKRKKEAEGAAMGGGSKARSDEFKHREELKRKEEEKHRAEVELMRATVSAKRDEMKNQAFLKAELQNAYKTGDQDKIRSLKRRLEPEEKR
mmetsp:Transcript_20258/g.58132  ORF Transcript_20258/g.58132 Transcript_20258/m.58132 type:complete len:418 (+) Transcript_20258:28-1281(+)